METRLKVDFRDLPTKAKRRMSKDQRSYADEFTFLRAHPRDIIEAWYAGELLAVWDGVDWKEPSHSE
jgi:hypothetical protein